MKKNKKPEYIATVRPLHTSHSIQTRPPSSQHSDNHRQQTACNSDTRDSNQEQQKQDKSSQETLQLSLLFLMSKFALTQDKSTRKRPINTCTCLPCAVIPTRNHALSIALWRWTGYKFAAARARLTSNQELYPTEVWAAFLPSHSSSIKQGSTL